jgi:hypothetical protein
MKKIYLLILICHLGLMSSFAQTEINSFNTTGRGYSTSVLSDYQCLGINPANLGWSVDNHAIGLGIGETGLTLYTNALNKDQVTNQLFNSNVHLTLGEKIDAASSFSDTRLIMQAAITELGISYTNKKIGGFALSVRDRVFWNTVLDHNAAQFLFMGYHAPYFDSLVVHNGDTTGYSKNPKPASLVYGNTSIQFVWYREFNLGYGRQIIDNDKISLYGGIGLKYLVGYGAIEFMQDKGNITAFSSLGPEFNINYNAPTPSEMSGSGLKSVGSGFGVDVGLTLKILKKITIGLSVTDIGSITWKGNVYQVKDVNIYKITTGGIDNYNIFNAGSLIKTDGMPGEGTLWEGLSSKTVKLPTQFRAGGSYSPIPMLEVGFDAIVPLNTKVPGSYDQPLFGLGGMIQPIKWVGISLGMVTGGNAGFNIPAGLTFYPIRNNGFSWELGLATRDVTIFFKNRDIMASVAFGFLRFNIGKS